MDSGLNSKRTRYSMQPSLTLSAKKKCLEKPLTKKFITKNIDELNSDNPFSMTTELQHTELSPQIKIGIKSIKKQNIKQEYTLMKLLRLLGTAYQYLSSYYCSEAIRSFKLLPKSQYNTAWVLIQIARALFESSKYADAEKNYKEAFSLEPYKVEGMEYYSSCLWHLKKQVDLCELSNKVVQITMFAPEVWCVIGNSFSLQRDHETALRFFTRATQIDPSFAYAYTLSGHEHVANHKHDQAKICYQRAMSNDEKHYNAFWGLGNIYMNEEKYDLAIQYFKRAVSINNRSPVLYTYLGITYFKKHQPHEALRMFEQAETLDPHNPLTQYQRATVLVSLKQFGNALELLDDLKKRLPKEAPVHLLIGKINYKLGNKDRALHHFNIAMDLNPKEANVIKSLIDRIENESLVES